MTTEATFEEDLTRTTRVRELQNEDFLLNTAERIVLKAEGCSLVLFYTLGSPVSRGAVDIWNELSSKIAGVNFFTVNASRRIDIMKAFSVVNNRLDHPLNAYRIRGFPTALVYREDEDGISWPKAFWNGDWDSDALTEWILTLACTPGYTEIPALREGVLSDEKVIVADPRAVGRDVPVSSLDYQSGDFNLQEEVEENALVAQEDFADRVYDEGLTDADVLADLETARAPTTTRLASFRSTEGTGSVSDPGWLDFLEDMDFLFADEF